MLPIRVNTVAARLVTGPMFESGCRHLAKKHRNFDGSLEALLK